MRTDFEPIKSFPIPAPALLMSGELCTGEPKLYLTAEGTHFDDEPYSYNAYGINGSIAFRVSWTDPSMSDPDFRPAFGFIEADAPDAIARVNPVKALGTLLTDIHPDSNKVAIQVNTVDGWSTIPGVRITNMSPDYGDLPGDGHFQTIMSFFTAGTKETAGPSSVWINMGQVEKMSLKKYKWDKKASKADDTATFRFGWSLKADGIFRLDYLPFSCDRLFPKVRVSFVAAPMQMSAEYDKRVAL